MGLNVFAFQTSLPSCESPGDTGRESFCLCTTCCVKDETLHSSRIDGLEFEDMSIWPALASPPRLVQARS